MGSPSTVSSAQNLSFAQRKTIALRAMRHHQPISEIAKDHQVSRKFVYTQQTKATNGVDQVFSPPVKDDEKILFWLPITKSWMHQLILCLVLNCRSSFRNATKVLNDAFDFSISIGTVSKIVQDAKQTAKAINAKQDLSNVILAANEELFHLNKLVLAGVDIPSLYCYLLSQEQQRDGDTWAIHLWDLEKQGFKPERIIADDGDGLRAGHKLALPHIPCDADHFHITKTLGMVQE